MSDSLPPALIFALTDLAPCISACKYALQIATWSSSWYNSWLILALWWAICLLPLRLFLPLVVLVPFALKRQPPEPLCTEKTLQNIIADITIIHSLRPRFPSTLSISLPKLPRVVAICYIPCLILSSFLSLHIIFAIAGTLLLSWRAPWAIIIRTTVWHSAWFRWSVYTLWSHVTGDPLPPRTMSPQSTSDSLAPVQSLRFLFTIYENQRWWVGLDWTAALLPAERPSWCSASQLPIPPPNAFTLPEDTTIYLPDAKGNKTKRTAMWKWEEPEWCVLVRKDGTGSGLTRVTRPFSTAKDESPTSSRFLKAATGRANSEIPRNAVFGNADEDILTAGSEESVDEDPLTDSDGWVYGDNKWEQKSNRGIMGKYTRYRRWTRIAAVYETVELDLPNQPTTIERETATPTSTLVDESSSSKHTISDVPSMDDPPESPLRQRLRMALNKGSTL